MPDRIRGVFERIKSVRVLFESHDEPTSECCEYCGYHKPTGKMCGTCGSSESTARTIQCLRSAAGGDADAE